MASSKTVGNENPLSGAHPPCVTGKKSNAWIWRLKMLLKPVRSELLKPAGQCKNHACTIFSSLSQYRPGTIVMIPFFLHSKKSFRAQVKHCTYSMSAGARGVLAESPRTVFYYEYRHQEARNQKTYVKPMHFTPISEKFRLFATPTLPPPFPKNNLLFSIGMVSQKENTDD